MEVQRLGWPTAPFTQDPERQRTEQNGGIYAMTIGIQLRWANALMLREVASMRSAIMYENLRKIIKLVDLCQLCSQDI